MSRYYNSEAYAFLRSAYYKGMKASELLRHAHVSYVLRYTLRVLNHTTDHHRSQGAMGRYELIILSTTRTPSTDRKI